jgi:hypothetical protein
MLQFKNNYDDRDVTVVARRVFDGVDGGSVTIEPGEFGEIDVDKDHQVIVSVVMREDAKAAPATADIPAASKGLSDGQAEVDDDDDDASGDESISGSSGEDVISGTVDTSDTLSGGSAADDLNTGGAQLREGSDDEVRSEIQAMVDGKEDLTRTGLPELPALNKRLAAKGIGPVDAERRTSLMSTPA